MRGFRLYDKNDVWAHFGVNFDKQAEIKKTQPVRRRTPVLCPVTGEPTYNPDGLDGRAWALMADGLHYAHVKESGELRSYITHSSNWYAATRGPTGFNPRPPDGSFLVSPTEYLKRLFPHTGERHEQGRLESFLKSGSILLETEHNAVASGYETGIYELELTEAEAAIARTLVNALMDTARALIMPAYRAGQSLLMNIAGDGITLEEISKITAKLK